MSDEPLRAIKTILVATDLSEGAAAAVRAAAWVAERLGAALHTAHAFEPVPEHAEKAVPGLTRAREEQARTGLDEFSAARRLPGTRHVLKGSAARELLLLAKQIKADLLVVGRQGAGKKRLGSVAERVVRHSPISVLVAAPEFAGQYRRPGVATDFDEGSDVALRRAAELCRSFGVPEVLILHAFEVPPGHHMIASWEDAVRRLAAVSDQLSREQIERALGAGAVKTRVRIDEGDAGEVSARLVGEEKIDLLVLGAQSRTRLAAALLGHTGERIIQSVTCGVWAEKAPGLAQGFLRAMRELMD